jgi:hypothetical protein
MKNNEGSPFATPICQYFTNATSEAIAGQDIEDGSESGCDESCLGEDVIDRDPRQEDEYD